MNSTHTQQSFQTEHYSSHSINHCAMNSSLEKQGGKLVVSCLDLQLTGQLGSNTKRGVSYRQCGNVQKGGPTEAIKLQK